MLKKSIFIISMVWFVLACSNDNQNSDEVSAVAETAGEMPVLKVENFETKAEAFVGQKILISGTVDHTCKHSGKKMVIVGENPDYSLKIMAGEVDQFNRELEGNDVNVVALVTETRMDANYLDEWEQEVLELHASDEDGGAEELSRIENFRLDLQKSEKGYLSFYGLDCVSYEVIAEAPASKEDKKEASEM